MDFANDLLQTQARLQTRRHFFKSCNLALGSLALGQLDGLGKSSQGSSIAPCAKRVIYLHMAGSPPQQDLFDYKPKLNELHMQDCPESLLEGKNFAFIKGTPKLLGTSSKFARYGESGAWMSDKLPGLQKHADKLCVVRSMTTPQFNHAPAQLLLHTGNAQFAAAPPWEPGRPTASAPPMKTYQVTWSWSPGAPIRAAAKLPLPGAQPAPHWPGEYTEGNPRSAELSALLGLSIKKTPVPTWDTGVFIEMGED